MNFMVNICYNHGLELNCDNITLNDSYLGLIKIVFKMYEGMCHG